MRQYPKEETVCIVGLGLMGGSAALALSATGATVIGVDHEPATLAAARAAGAIASGTQSLADGVRGATLVVLATPVRTIIQLVHELAAIPHDGCLVIDLGSTKQAVCEAMDRLPSPYTAVGGHPMCGKEEAGFGAASATLYRDCTFVLAKTSRTTEQAWLRSVALVNRLGAQPLAMQAAQHDVVVAVTSHLPYLVASLTMRQAAAAAVTEPMVWPVSATGLKDTTRLAGTSPEVMRDILLTNRDAVLVELQAYGRALDELAVLLAANDESGLMSWLRETAAAHRSYRTRRKEA